MITSPPLFADAPDLGGADYCILGLASCFVKTEEGLEPVEVIEPISSASLEAILKGIPTSYKMATATDLQGIFQDDRPQIPPAFPSNAQFCQDFTERLIAAARTYKSSPSGQDHIPLGTVRRDFNFSVERKRVLNAVNVVRTEDNVKQHPHTHQAL